MDTPSLLELTRSLATDEGAKASFRADPEGFLDEHGHGDLTPDDLAVALRHAADALTPALAIPVRHAADAGADLLDQLLELAGIDPVEAEMSWTELTYDADELAVSTDHDPGGGLDAVGSLGPDPDALDHPTAGHDPDADLDDAANAHHVPGGEHHGLDPVEGAHTFGAGADEPGVGDDAGPPPVHDDFVGGLAPIDDPDSPFDLDDDPMPDASYRPEGADTGDGDDDGDDEP